MQKINYTGFQSTRLSFTQRFAARRLLRIYGIVAGLTVLLCILLAWNKPIEPLLAYVLLTVFCSVSLLVTAIIAYTFDGESTTIKKFTAFARDNAFTYMPKTPSNRSVLVSSMALNNSVYAQHQRRADRCWRLEGIYDSTPFAIERLEAGGTTYAYRDNAPSFITALIIPLSTHWPDMAFCSKELADGITAFQCACIWPSSQWERFYFDGLTDGTYSAYYISPHDAPRLEDTDKITAYLKELVREISCDIEISQGMLYIYTSGMTPVTQESYERFFRIIDRSKSMLE